MAQSRARVAPAGAKTTRSRATKKAEPVKLATTTEEIVNTIAEDLHAAARKQGLCDEYYRVLERLNKKLATPLPIPKMRRIIAVTVYVAEENEMTDNSRQSYSMSTTDSTALRTKVEEAVKTAGVTLAASYHTDVSVSGFDRVFNGEVMSSDY